MNQQPQDRLGEAVADIVAKNVRRFRLFNAAVLVALAVAVVVAVACLDWLPRWPVYVLVAALVLAALSHGRLNRAFAEGETQVWNDILTLPAEVEAKARPGTERALPQRQATKPVPRSGPPLRVIWPDGEQAGEGS